MALLQKGAMVYLKNLSVIQGLMVILDGTLVTNRIDLDI